MQRKFWTGDKLLSVAAVLVSLLTLGVFGYQTNLIRQQQYMSVYPHLSFSNKFSGSLQYQYVLKNDGIGPAMIDSVLVVGPNGKDYLDLVYYVDDVIPPEDSIWYLHSNISSGKLIPPNVEIPLIQLVNHELLAKLGINDVATLPQNDVQDAKQLFSILNHDSLTIQITYKSIYGEKWLIKSGSGSPVKLD
ncbi:MAG: hypothetical protein ACMVP2_01640 [Imperialibacter sp.]|uniref:hypothetical protein n=1 Tax=Imperialibacter sp. TaxID=2038411 RepID=UPI003A845991